MDKNFKQLNEELEEILEPRNEMSMAWVDQYSKKCCWIENPNTHENNYFKYLNSFSYRKADQVARISLKEPKYLKHNNRDGKKNWILSNEEKRELVDLMNSPSQSHEGFTNWQSTIIQYNFDNFFIPPVQTMKSTFDKEKYPEAFDINYPMPNYLELN